MQYVEPLYSVRPRTLKLAWGTTYIGLNYNYFIDQVVLYTN